MRMVLLFLCLAASLVTANVEKAIFLGPPSINVPLQQPTLSSLNLDTLTPESSTIRTRLPRSFQTGDSPGQTSWLILDGLTEGQRYELRVCWSAMEPTAFDIETFDVEHVFETPELIQSLSDFAYARVGTAADPVDVTTNETEKTSSVLFVRIITAADYYSDYTELMENPPPVLVDLILDPFLFNVLPRSLLPTGGYIICVAIVAWFVASYITSQVKSFAECSSTMEKKKQ
ncbi:uncharacterized protein F5Z01DRAFT_671087 [Emericellopsis atlantica]|uniref:Uncharacterized protein n=1 Tax=Emericellopsis atlantica TaxID=2614577 RepID=A0A9P8CSS3_9HYPO|nr:uncharacterized protein F5Z01DRAFT_671087 [Emericellopsis atlantica]KAG9257490.1 hypothetical protein F5Z01DRAFT_671087 [Emericellopsis atlantica]